MFGRKDEKPRKRQTPRGNLAQFGFMDMNFDTTSGTEDTEEADDDLKAELLALTSEESSSVTKSKKPKPKPIPQEALDKMVSESMKDDGDDEDDSMDGNDPDLLSELYELTRDSDEDMPESSTPVSVDNGKPIESDSIILLLESRLKMYQAAEARAKAGGEDSRARRFSRGVKSLSDQLKAAHNGQTVNEEDIPPPVSIGTPAPASAHIAPVDDSTSSDDSKVPIRRAPPPPVSVSPAPISDPECAPPDGGPPEETSTLPYDSDIVCKLEERRGQYRQAAVAAKRAGNREDALKFASIVKQFDIVIDGVKAGEHADLSEMPPPPWEIKSDGASGPPSPSKEEEQQQRSSEPPPPPEMSGPTVPTTIMEALTQRLELYLKQETAAKADNNSSKARRMGRIVKQYQDAIKAVKNGESFPFEELPTPPGFAEIPVQVKAPSDSTLPVPEPVSTCAGPATPPASQIDSNPSSGSSTGSTARANVRKSPSSRQEKQLALLLSRQKEFKIAALRAKTHGELNQAKEYLRISKGFDKLIEATESGLPVDLKTLPVPPDTKVELETDFDLVSFEDCVPGSDDEIYDKLLKDLLTQIQTCMSTRDHFKAIGDVASANRFENMAVHCKKDMNTIQHAIRHKDPVPKFHYETKSFSIVQCCTELMDNDLEITIVQGINYNVPNPKDVDTYVRFELPWPSEDPQRDRTALVKNTNNPEYNAKFTLQIQRNVRACQRIFKRHSIKCEVWSRGGFLRGDVLIGAASVKLQPLENKCVVHDSFDLMDGRKAVGGKLEVKVRIRNPIVTKQVEQVTEKWLVIDHQ